MKFFLTCTATLFFSSAFTTEYSRVNKELLEASIEDGKSAIAESRKERSFAEKELTIEKKIELPYKTKKTQNLCEADISLSYTQADTAVRVKTAVSVVDGFAECSDARGEYLIRVRSMNSNGKPRTQEFNESWALSADRSLTQAHTYDLQTDPDLLWVRIRSSRNTQCVCETKADPVLEPAVTPPA